MGDHIEMEVTAGDGAWSRSPNAPRTAESERSGDTARVIAVGLIALMIGLVGGWVARGDSGEADVDDQADAPAPSPSSSLETLPGIGTLPPPSTSEPPRTTTTPAITQPNQQPGSTTSIGLSPEVVGLDIQLVMLDGHDLIEIDFATSQRTYLGEVPVAANEGGIELTVGNEWVAVRDWTGAQVHIYRDGEAPVAIDATLDVTLVDPSGDTFWMFRPADTSSAAASGFVWEEWDPSGELTGRRIELPSYSFALTTAGFLMPTDNGVYLGDDSGIRRISAGSLLALGRNHLAFRVCDDQLQCRAEIHPLDGGDVEYLADDVSPIHFGGYWHGEASLSPTGTWIARTGCPGAEIDPARGTVGFCFTDRATGENIVIDEVLAGSQPVLWSRTGDHAILADHNAVYVFDTKTREIVETGIGGVFPSVVVRLRP